jgi:hypothetical protein
VVGRGAPVVHPVIVHATAELTIYWFPKIGAVVATFPANRASAHARHQLVASPGSRAQGVISGHAAALHGVVFRTGAGTKPGYGSGLFKIGARNVTDCYAATRFQNRPKTLTNLYFGPSAGRCGTRSGTRILNRARPRIGVCARLRPSHGAGETLNGTPPGRRCRIAQSPFPRAASHCHGNGSQPQGYERPAGP